MIRSKDKGLVSGKPETNPQMFPERENDKIMHVSNKKVVMTSGKCLKRIYPTIHTHKKDKYETGNANLRRQWPPFPTDIKGCMRNRCRWHDLLRNHPEIYILERNFMNMAFFHYHY